MRQMPLPSALGGGCRPVARAAGAHILRSKPTMPLHLVHGPPNSGRAGVVRERFGAALRRDPVLVLPNLDDVFAFERELCADGSALVGGSVLVFEGLFGEVANAAGQPTPATLTAAQRLRIARAAIGEVELGPLRVSATRPGFAAALVDLIGDLQAAGLSPEAVAGGASTLEGSAYLDDLTALYSAYAGLRDHRGHADSHTVARAAIAALRQDPDSWGGRPVLPLRLQRPHRRAAGADRGPLGGNRGHGLAHLRGPRRAGRPRAPLPAAARAGAGVGGGDRGRPRQHRQPAPLSRRARLPARGRNPDPSRRWADLPAQRRGSRRGGADRVADRPPAGRRDKAG